MTLELTIQALFDHYPMLFKTRADCLNQLFCVLGNGYDWVDGQLVSPSMPRPKRDPGNGRARQERPLTLREEALWRYENCPRTLPGNVTRERLEAAAANLPNRLHWQPRRKRWYFGDPDEPGRVDFHEDFVPLFRHPKDMDPDWREGIEETRRLLHEDGFILP